MFTTPVVHRPQVDVAAELQVQREASIVVEGNPPLTCTPVAEQLHAPGGGLNGMHHPGSKADSIAINKPASSVIRQDISLNTAPPPSGATYVLAEVIVR